MRICIRSASNTIDLKNAKIRLEVYDSYSGWITGAVICEYSDIVIGKIDIQLSDDENEIYINMIEVLPEYRRQGIATKMFDFLRSEYSDYYVDWGFTTPDGTKLKAQLTRTEKNPEYENIEKSLQTIEKMLHDAEVKLNDDNWLEHTEQSVIDKVSDRWQKLYSKKRDLEQDLEDLREYITVWK